MKSKAITSSNTCDKELIDVSVSCDTSDVTEELNLYPYWMQMYIPETLSIPPQKPDVETINSINISVNIIRTEVIKTPRSYTKGAIPVAVPNLEGKLLSGRKLIIEGELCQKVEYTANLTDQPVHSAHFYVPFSSYIVVPETIEFTNDTAIPTILDSLDVNFEVNSCIEDVSICLINTRTFLKKVTLLLYAIPTQSN